MNDDNLMVCCLDYETEFNRLVECYNIVNDENEKLRKALLNLALAIK